MMLLLGWLRNSLVSIYKAASVRRGLKVTVPLPCK